MSSIISLVLFLWFTTTYFNLSHSFVYRISQYFCCLLISSLHIIVSVLLLLHLLCIRKVPDFNTRPRNFLSWLRFLRFELLIPGEYLSNTFTYQQSIGSGNVNISKTLLQKFSDYFILIRLRKWRLRFAAVPYLVSFDRSSHFTSSCFLRLFNISLIKFSYFLCFALLCG
jgi:hypothetical protein